MRSINKVIIIGNLTRDPEMRQTPNGQTVTTFGVATNREWVTREGEKKNSAEFHECVAWARLAEICHKYLRKGRLVYVEGYLKTRSWDTPEGIKKFKTEIVIQDMIMLEKKGSEEEEFLPDSGKDFSSQTKTTPEKKDTEEKSEEAEKVEEVATEETKVEEEVATEETTTASEDTSTEENPIDKDLGL